jgi:hypothetical protein
MQGSEQKNSTHVKYSWCVRGTVERHPVYTPVLGVLSVASLLLLVNATVALNVSLCLHI